MWNKFRNWKGHPEDAGAVTLLLAPLWAYLDIVWLIPLTGVVFGLIHEGLQYFFGVGHKEETFNWRDVLDFSVGGWIATLFIWLLGR